MAALLDQTVKKIKGPAGASVNNASGMLWAADCCSSAGHWDIQPDCVTLQATSVQENNALWFQNDCLPPATLLLTTVISKYGPRGGGGAVLHEWKQHGCSLICWSISVLGKKAHKYWAGRICMCHPRAQFSRWKMRTEPWQFLPVSLLDRKIENDRESYLSKDTVSGQKPG